MVAGFLIKKLVDANMPFEKGNKLGAKPRLFDQALRRAILADDGKRIREAAEQLLDLAAAGEQWAVRELADRLDGKPEQTVGGTGEGGAFTLIAPWLTQQILVRNGGG